MFRTLTVEVCSPLVWSFRVTYICTYNAGVVYRYALCQVGGQRYTKVSYLNVDIHTGEIQLACFNLPRCSGLRCYIQSFLCRWDEKPSFLCRWDEKPCHSSTCHVPYGHVTQIATLNIKLRSPSIKKRIVNVVKNLKHKYNIGLNVYFFCKDYETS